MNLAFNIAKRYLYAKKSQNVINVISLISVFGVLTGSMALIIVLSVFNGIHGFMGSLYGTFDPDLKLIPATGKVISTDSIDINKIKHTKGILHISEILEDQALLKFSKRRMPGMVLGVDTNFNKVSRIDSIIVDGEFKLKHKSEFRGVIGRILADQLALRLNFVTPLSLYVPKRKGNINMMSPQNAFKKEYLSPSGIFAVKQNEYDANYIIVSIEQARRLFQYDSTIVSALTIKVDSNKDIYRIEKEVQDIVGNKMSVLNPEEQHASFYKVMKVEKLMAFLILCFILIIAAFNIVASLSMLIFEKKESIFTLKSMGASRMLITRIFLIEGWLISLIGVLVGTAVGVILVYIQQQFGIVKFGSSGSYLVEAYPVALQWLDVIISIIAVSGIGFLAAWYPVRVIVQKYYSESGM